MHYLGKYKVASDTKSHSWVRFALRVAWGLTGQVLWCLRVDCVCWVPWVIGSPRLALLQPGPSSESSGFAAPAPGPAAQRCPAELEPAQPSDRPGPGAPISLTGYTRTTLKTTWSGVVMDQSVKNQPSQLFHQFFLNKQSGWLYSVICQANIYWGFHYTAGPGLEREIEKDPASKEPRGNKGPKGPFFSHLLPLPPVDSSGQGLREMGTRSPQLLPAAEGDTVCLMEFPSSAPRTFQNLLLVF